MNNSTLIVQHNIYHQRVGFDPTGRVYAYERVLEDRGPPYEVPVFVVGTDWTEIPTGHVKIVGLISLKNCERVTGARIGGEQTPESREQALNKTVEITTCKNASFDLLPSESQAFRPHNGTTPVFARCRSGLATCSLLVIPG